MILDKILPSLLYDPQNPLIFTSTFFLFFFVALIFFYPLVVSRIKVRTWYLMIASLFFYYKTSGAFVLLLVITAGINYLIGFGIANSESKVRRRLLITLSVIWNLGSLGYYKYSNFLLDTINDVFGGNLPALDIFLPVGISFFTFQTMSYTLDIFYGKLKPIHSFADFLFFVSFFPQLVAGPIVRAAWFIPQINQRLSLDRERVAKALVLIFAGLIKKGVIADYISVNFVDRVFDNPALYSGLENLLALYGYSLQVYCDFSGYSDIAIGLAILLGFNLPQNFNSPYRATSLGDFWHRWHISLSTWLRDYLYFPLGGSRKGKARTYVNLMVTMVLGGLWHGASWNFVLWGALNGAGLSIERFFRNLFWPKRNGAPLRKTALPLQILGVVFTFNFITFTRIFFRNRSFAGSLMMIERIFTDLNARLFFTWLKQYQMVAALIAAGYLLHWLPGKFKLGFEGLLQKSPVPVQAAFLALVIWVLYQFRAADIQPFIYFQF
ncbi:MAG: MBOAT family protein [Candidatus Cloacimonetes bacterium]|nr:MBOAT family protein [Candidatus Cloacimonadota bacterium]